MELPGASAPLARLNSIVQVIFAQFLKAVLGDESVLQAFPRLVPERIALELHVISAGAIVADKKGLANIPIRLK